MSWTDAVFAGFKPSDHHIRADEIFAILNAESDGESAADLCAAKGFTVPMYCVWKTKYRHLHLDELREARRRELWFGRGLLGVIVAVVVLGTGGIVFGLARAAFGNSTAAAELPIHVAATPATESAGRQPDRGAHIQPISAPASAPAAPLVEPQPRSDEPSSITERGYKIQVAAAQSLQEGRAVVERLGSAGYPAYLVRAMVNNSEVFRVRVGPFDTPSAAEEIASKLQRDGFSGAWIAR